MAETAKDRTALDGRRTRSAGRNQRILLFSDRERQASESDDGRHGCQTGESLEPRPDEGHPMGNAVIRALRLALEIDGKELIAVEDLHPSESDSA